MVVNEPANGWLLSWLLETPSVTAINIVELDDALWSRKFIPRFLVSSVALTCNTKDIVDKEKIVSGVVQLNSVLLDARNSFESFCVGLIFSLAL